MQAEIQGGRASVRNLRSKIHKLDEEALKQQEILYTQDFQLQQLQHKLNRMEGERTDDEKLALNARIAVSISYIVWYHDQINASLITLITRSLRVNGSISRGRSMYSVINSRDSRMT